jgi:hypothetical protein
VVVGIGPLKQTAPAEGVVALPRKGIGGMQLTTRFPPWGQKEHETIPLEARPSEKPRCAKAVAGRVVVRVDG